MDNLPALGRSTVPSRKCEIVYGKESTAVVTPLLSLDAPCAGWSVDRCGGQTSQAPSSRTRGAATLMQGSPGHDPEGDRFRMAVDSMTRAITLSYGGEPTAVQGASCDIEEAACAMSPQTGVEPRIRQLQRRCPRLVDVAARLPQPRAGCWAGFAGSPSQRRVVITSMSKAPARRFGPDSHDGGRGTADCPNRGEEHRAKGG